MIQKIQNVSKDYNNKNMVYVYYKDLSYELNGLAFEMFKYCGYG